MENKTISDEPLYVMTIELDEGKSSNVKIFLDSKPEELAFDFCKENNLDYSSMSYLSNQIKTLMEKFTNEITKENNECIEELEEENTNTKRKQKKKKDRKDFFNLDNIPFAIPVAFANNNGSLFCISVNIGLIAFSLTIFSTTD